MSKRSSRRPHGELRIIAGEYRRRKIPVPPGDAVRPTGDRVRETLFNWIAPVLAGMRCLDLFAGTGALGLEALSRGAARVRFVERDAILAAHLEKTLASLGSRRGTVVQADALQFLEREPESFDLVFLDPPFGSQDIGNLCTLLDRNWLAPGGRIYIELPRKQDFPLLPESWTVDHDKTSRECSLRAGQASLNSPEEKLCSDCRRHVPRHF